MHEAVRALRTGRSTTVLAFVILTLAMATGTTTFSVIDAGTEPGNARAVEESFRRLTAGRRFNAALMSAFGLVASPSRVLWLVLTASMRRVIAGICLGLAGAWTISGAFAAFVFRIRPTDPVAYLAVAVVITLVGVLAALHAARLDPLVALRHE